MDLSTDKIPNKMLTGDELLECAVAEFREMLRRDCMFIHTIAYRRVAFTLQATFHFGYPHPADHVVKSRTKKEGVLEGEVPLDPLCKCGHECNRLHRMNKGEDQSCFGIVLAGAGTVPCLCKKFEPADEEDSLLSLERDVNLTNPNLARVHHDLPIVVQERKLPRANPASALPGEPSSDITNPYPEFETHKLRYDKTQYPPADPVVDRDVSDKKAAEMGVKRRTRS